MIAFTTLIYVGAIYLFFAKLKLVKPTPWSIGVAVVIGIGLISGIVIGWKFSSPTSSNLVVSQYTVQLVPQVSGQIAKIHAKANEPLKKGEDILFEIVKQPYQFAVDQFTGQLSAAENQVRQAQAGTRAANANVDKTQAAMRAAQAELDVARQTEKLNPDAISKIRVTQLEEQFNSANAAVEQAAAAAEQAEFGVKSAEQTVSAIQAQLENAQFDLEQCTVYAPADGFVSNWQAREGTMSVTLPLAPVGTFIDTSETFFVANFGQNIVKNVKPNDPVEISLKTRPGEVFTGEVDAVIQGTGEGQFVTSGQFISAADIGSDGMFVVRFKMDDEKLTRPLAMGTAGTVVIYTDKGKPFHIISKVVVRMNAWMYYLLPF